MENSVTYIKRLLLAIGSQDKLHAKTLRKGMEEMRSREYWHLVGIIQAYFTFKGIKVKQIAEDYLHMVIDMRNEMKYFQQEGEYSCKSEKEAYVNYYSNPDVMRYYMNALVISHILWSHHFKMIQFFRSLTSKYGEFGNGREIILDVGAGHGLFSKTIIETMPNYKRIDVMDISDESLNMAHAFLGDDRIEYIKQDIKTFLPFYKYDIVIMGEILEHMDDPLAVLKHASTLLSKDGVIWITVPTNAPAIDHIYLFRNKMDVLRLIDDAGLMHICSETIDVDSQTQLIGLFCSER